jgi:hypothetical protein
LSTLVKPLTVDSIACQAVEMAAPDGADQPQALRAVIIPRPNQTLFVKLMGDRDLADQEQANFDRFVQSLRFPDSP